MSEEKLFEIRKVVTMTLIKIGIRCDLCGFDYLRYAIELVIQDPTLTRGVCKRLYVMISEHFNVSNVACVERNIRHAIETTYIFKNFNNLNQIIGMDVFTIKEKPTVGELIRIIAEYYSLGLYKEEFARLKNR